MYGVLYTSWHLNSMVFCMSKNNLHIFYSKILKNLKGKFLIVGSGKGQKYCDGHKVLEGEALMELFCGFPYHNFSLREILEVFN